MSNETEVQKVVAITGGAQGIGLAIARRFATDGHAIALLDVNERSLAGATRDPTLRAANVIGIVCDLCDAAACAAAMEQTLDRLGRLDVLVNNAGVGFHAPLEKLSVADIDATLDVNARAPMLLARAILPHMVNRGSGSIINISSASAKIGAANLAPYSASKAALIGFTRALAIELMPKGIRVNAVCPGITNTAMMDNNIRDRMQAKGVTYEAALAEFVSIMPDRQMVEPEDIAAAVAFLASDQARKITGEALNVSTGFVMW